MRNFEAELVGNEIGYIRPRRAKLKDIAEAIIGIVLIAGFVAFLLWVASHQF